MTPPAATAAATGHRHGVRRSPAPRGPRRVSGPARPRAVAGGAVAVPRATPRRGTESLGARALRRLAALPEHRLLDRLLTGRAWIGIVAFALIGIVFMQVSLLKLNAGIGRAVEHASVLDRENAGLRFAVSSLGSNDRIQAEAERLGLVLPPAGSVVFLGRDGRRVGGDADTSLAAGTATAPAPAGLGAGATAAAPAPTPSTVVATPAATSSTGTTSATTTSTGTTGASPAGGAATSAGTTTTPAPPPTGIAPSAATATTPPAAATQQAGTTSTSATP